MCIRWIVRTRRRRKQQQRPQLWQSTLRNLLFSSSKTGNKHCYGHKYIRCAFTFFILYSRLLFVLSLLWPKQLSQIRKWQIEFVIILMKLFTVCIFFFVFLFCIIRSKPYCIYHALSYVTILCTRSIANTARSIGLIMKSQQINVHYFYSVTFLFVKANGLAHTRYPSICLVENVFFFSIRKTKLSSYSALPVGNLKWIF